MGCRETKQPLGPSVHVHSPTHPLVPLAGGSLDDDEQPMPPCEVRIGGSGVHSIVGLTWQVCIAVAGMLMLAVRFPGGVVRVVDPSVAPV